MTDAMARRIYRWFLRRWHAAAGPKSEQQKQGGPERDGGAGEEDGGEEAKAKRVLASRMYSERQEEIIDGSERRNRSMSICRMKCLVWRLEEEEYDNKQLQCTRKIFAWSGLA